MAASIGHQAAPHAGRLVDPAAVGVEADVDDAAVDHRRRLDLDRGAGEARWSGRGSRPPTRPWRRARRAAAPRRRPRGGARRPRRARRPPPRRTRWARTPPPERVRSGTASAPSRRRGGGRASRRPSRRRTPSRPTTAGEAVTVRVSGTVHAGTSVRAVSCVIAVGHSVEKVRSTPPPYMPQSPQPHCDEAVGSVGAGAASVSGTRPMPSGNGRSVADGLRRLRLAVDEADAADRAVAVDRARRRQRQLDADVGVPERPLVVDGEAEGRAARVGRDGVQHRGVEDPPHERPVRVVLGDDAGEDARHATTRRPAPPPRRSG